MLSNILIFSVNGYTCDCGNLVVIMMLCVTICQIQLVQDDAPLGGMLTYSI